MRKMVSVMLALAVMLTCAETAFASDLNYRIDVYARSERRITGEYNVWLDNGGAEMPVGDVTITVTGAPEDAVRLVVIAMEGESKVWISGCVEGSLLAAYDIHFLDAYGNRINADGASVIVSAPKHDGKLMVSSVTSAGVCKSLTASDKNGKISFITNGSPYYAIAQKVKTEKPDDPGKMPPTGDSAQPGMMLVLMTASLLGLAVILREEKRSRAHGTH